MRLLRKFILASSMMVASFTAQANEDVQSFEDFVPAEGNISFYNDCYKPITVAFFFYNAIQQTWAQHVTNVIPAGSNTSGPAMTHTEFYYYAESTDRSIIWNGSDLYRSIRGRSGQYGFRKARVNRIGQFVPFRLTCSN